MKFKRKESGKPQFDFPAPMYFIAKMVKTVPFLGETLHSLELSRIGKGIQTIKVDRPIYVTGLARAGTTITLEMLSQHPDVGTHRYLHMVLPYAPQLVQWIADKTPLMLSPTERIHKDGIMVNRNSPEAVEEIFWQRYFQNTLDESKTNIMRADSSNPEFETFYRDHIKKLLLDQKRTRYAAKNNYNVSRLEYLQRIMPNVKFLIIIRNPFDHIASLAKQDIILSEIERQDPRLLDWTKIIGHREFGTAKICINFDNSDLVKEIRNDWKDKMTYVAGWAKYWASAYSYVHETLKNNSKLDEAVLVVKYETLCEKPDQTIDRILEHTELDSSKFKEVKQRYVKSLHPPTYYSVKYTEEETESIKAIAGPVAKFFGYDLAN
ncbi:MAG: sulfotransferase [Candidatus Thorarchaeota archaeon]|nr:sulfotransferase [Candidatus Thorarchaeota archaeon]